MIAGGGLIATRDHELLVASDPDRDLVWIVDVETGRVRHRVPLRRGDRPGRLAEDIQARVHVVLRGAGAVATIDLRSGELTARTDACAAPRGIDVDRARGLLRVACEEGSLVTLSLGSLEVVRRDAIGPDLRDVVVDTRGRVLTTRFRSAAMDVLDASLEPMFQRSPPVFTLPPPADPGPHQRERTYRPNVAWSMKLDASDGVWLAHQRAAEFPVERKLAEDDDTRELASVISYGGPVLVERSALGEGCVPGVRDGAGHSEQRTLRYWGRPSSDDPRHPPHLAGSRASGRGTRRAPRRPMSPLPQLASVLLLMSACDVPTDAGDPCAEASAHIADCLGTGAATSSDECDASTAEQVAALSCEDIAAIPRGEKADYDDYVLCQVGFDFACHASVRVDDEDWFGFSLRDGYPGEHAERWYTASDSRGFVGGHYHATAAGYDDDSPHDASAWAEWRPTLPRYGLYRIRVSVAPSSDNSPDAMYRVSGGSDGIWGESGGLYEVRVDQRTADADGWIWLGEGLSFQLAPDPTISAHAPTLPARPPHSRRDGIHPRGRVRAGTLVFIFVIRAPRAAEDPPRHVHVGAVRRPCYPYDASMVIETNTGSCTL